MVLFLFVRRYCLSIPLLKADRVPCYYVDVEEFLGITVLMILTQEPHGNLYLIFFHYTLIIFHYTLLRIVKEKKPPHKLYSTINKNG
jgi:hypothetical protein